MSTPAGELPGFSQLLKRQSLLAIFAKLGIKTSERVLNVGCGVKATLLLSLERLGFTRLAGCDPFTERSKSLSSSIDLNKGQVDELAGDAFDVIVSKHSFEHIYNPEEFSGQLQR